MQRSNSNGIQPARRTVRYKVSVSKKQFSFLSSHRYLQPVLHRLKGLLYEATNATPSIVNVPTLADPQGPHRFPCIESLLGTRATIHDCVVSVVDSRGEEHQFLLSCQVGDSLPFNRPLRMLSPNIPWDGSLLIMKMGRRASFVGFTGSDRELAKAAVAK